MKLISFFFFLHLFNIQLCAQGDLYGIINQKLENHAKHTANTQLYLHMDKSVYVVNENIWFSAYILKTPFEVKEHHTLFVFLSDKSNNRIVAEEKFVIENGLASGYLFIPDSLGPGNYSFMAYTNRFPDEPAKIVFHQTIRIASSSADFLEVKMSNAVTNSINTKFTFQMRHQNILVDKTLINYQLRSDDRIVAKGTAKLNSTSEFSFTVPIGIPWKMRTSLFVEIEQEGVLYKKNIPIVTPAQPVNIRWFPEGGDLVQDLPGRVAFEVARTDGLPVTALFSLMDGDEKIANLQTNKSGIGIFE